jgi:thiol-disulfide isomerase/thioredoxin
MLLKEFNSIEKGKQLINKTKTNNILVLYYAEWCGWCQKFKPEWEKIHKEIAKSNICEVAEVESDELQYTKPLQSHFQGFPSLVLYTKKEITNPRNNGLMNMFMGQTNEPKLPTNAIKYDGDRTLYAIQAFLKQHIPQSSNSKDKATSKSKTTSRNKQRKTMKGGMRKQGKSGKKTKKNTTTKNKKQHIKPKHSSSNNYNKTSEYFTKQEIAKMKKERKKSAQIVSRLKRELNTTFKV